MKNGADPVIYVRASARDAQELLRVRREAVITSGRGIYPDKILLAWAPNITLENIEEQRRLLSDDDRITLVARMGDSIIGLCTLGISEGLVKQCYTLPGFQGMGVAASLMREIEKIAIDKGLKELKLSSSMIALPFYKKIGYIELNEYDYPLSEELFMRCVMMGKEVRSDRC